MDIERKKVNDRPQRNMPAHFFELFQQLPVIIFYYATSANFIHSFIHIHFYFLLLIQQIIIFTNAHA